MVKASLKTGFDQGDRHSPVSFCLICVKRAILVASKAPSFCHRPSLGGGARIAVCEQLKWAGSSPDPRTPSRSERTGPAPQSCGECPLQLIRPHALIRPHTPAAQTPALLVILRRDHTHQTRGAVLPALTSHPQSLIHAAHPARRATVRIAACPTPLSPSVHLFSLGPPRSSAVRDDQGITRRAPSGQRHH